MANHTFLFALRTEIDILASYAHNLFLQDRFAAIFVGQKAVISYPVSELAFPANFLVVYVGG